MWINKTNISLMKNYLWNKVYIKLQTVLQVTTCKADAC